MAESLVATLRKLANRRLGAVFLLGFAAGLPFSMTQSTLQLWLADEGVDLSAIALMALAPGAPTQAQLPGLAGATGIDLTTIALFGLVALPYSLKIFWSPLMDRFVPPWLGRRRGWMLITQLAMVAGLVGMAVASPTRTPTMLALMAILVAFAAASHDIVIDAWRTDILPPDERGAGASLSVGGYRVGMLVAGGLAPVIGGWTSWEAAYLVVAALIGVGVIATAFAPPAEVARPPRTLRAAIVEPLREFLTRRRALWLLALVLLYKLTDAVAATLFYAFLRKGVGFSPVEIGFATKSVGFPALLVGLAIGGVWMARLGLYRSLLVFGVLQALSNLVFMALAAAGHDTELMLASIVVENVTGGMGTAAYVALLMALCDHRFSATQYALLSSLMAVGRILIGPLGGPVIESVGWAWFFFSTALIAIPGLALLVWLREQVRALDQRPPAVDTT